MFCSEYNKYITFFLCVHLNLDLRRHYSHCSPQFQLLTCQQLFHSIPFCLEYQNKYLFPRCVAKIRLFILIKYSGWDFFGYASYINNILIITLYILLLYEKASDDLRISRIINLKIDLNP